jgi:hypothetical protein
MTLRAGGLALIVSFVGSFGCSSDIDIGQNVRAGVAPAEGGSGGVSGAGAGSGGLAGTGGSGVSPAPRFALGRRVGASICGIVIPTHPEARRRVVYSM